MLIWQSVNPQLEHTKKGLYCSLYPHLATVSHMQTNMSKAPLQRIPKAENYFLSFSFSFSFFFLFLFFLSFFHSVYSAYSISLNLQIRLSLKNPSLNVSSITVIQLNGDLHYLRDHPSLFCTLTFTMAIFLSISEQQKRTRSFPPSSCHYTVEATLPGDPNPALLHTHTPSAPRTALHYKPSASPSSKKSRFTTYHSDQRMISTSADLLPAQSYKTAKHFLHQPMGVRSHFTTELSSIKQTDKHQGNIHVESTHMHRCTLKPWKNHTDGYQWNNTHSHADCVVSGQLLFVLIDWRGLERTQPKNAVPNAPAVIA